MRSLWYSGKRQVISRKSIVFLSSSLLRSRSFFVEGKERRGYIFARGLLWLSRTFSQPHLREGRFGMGMVRMGKYGK
jgi:hypothetical protein